MALNAKHISLLKIGAVATVFFIVFELWQSHRQQKKLDQFLHHPEQFPKIVRFTISNTDLDITDAESLKVLNEALAMEERDEGISGGQSCYGVLIFSDGWQAKIGMTIHSGTLVSIDNDDEEAPAMRNILLKSAPPTKIVEELGKLAPKDYRFYVRQNG